MLSEWRHEAKNTQEGQPSPVYSLDVHSAALWALAGLEVSRVWSVDKINRMEELIFIPLDMMKEGVIIRLTLIVARYR